MTRAERIELTADAVRANIHDTIHEAGGDWTTLDGYQRAGWDSPEHAVDAHHDDAWIVWLQYAPRTVRSTRKLLARFEIEWPAVRRAALA